MKNKQNIVLILNIMFIFFGCAGQDDLHRKIVIVDIETQEMIPNANIHFATIDTTYGFQTKAIPDTLNILLESVKYRIEVTATGYKKIDKEFVLTDIDKLLTIGLLPIELESVNVSWEGASITIKDSSGNFKRIWHTNN